MSQPLIVPLPRNLVLSGGYTISVDALDPTTGASVAGVKISGVTIQVEQTAGPVEDTLFGPFMLVTGPGG